MNLLPDEEYLRPGVITFLAHVDTVLVDNRVPTCATGLYKGKLLLLLGERYLACEDQEARGEMLAHECAHFLMGHLGRRGERQPRPWNAVIDASLHWVGAADWQLIEEAMNKGWKGEQPIRLVTFERLLDKDTNMPMAPMPPEMAYERLPVVTVVCDGNCDEHGPGGHDTQEGEGCGSMEHSHHDGSTESMTKRVITAGKVISADKEFAARLRGESSQNAGLGRGSRLAPDLPPPAPWIRQTLQWLIHGRKRAQRRRSWRRENRSFPVLPSKVRLHTLGGLFIIDASGSISDDMMGEFLSAVMHTPELKGSEVVIFDSYWTDYIPITDHATIMAKVKEMGGGTTIRAVGQAYKHDPRPRVWITDGYSGDGWPDPHTAADIWCVWDQGPTPPHATAVIHIKRDS
jgi:hypothetical protein